MAYDHDEQLIEATAVRRTRLARALLFGEHRLLRSWTDRVGTHLAAAFLAVLACAGCVAASFIINLFANDDRMGRTAPTPDEVTVSTLAAARHQPSATGAPAGGAR